MANGPYCLAHGSSPFLEFQFGVPLRLDTLQLEETPFSTRYVSWPPRGRSPSLPESLVLLRPGDGWKEFHV